jgi:hypothetical protein
LKKILSIVLSKYMSEPDKYDVVISNIENESIIRKRDYDSINSKLSNEKLERVDGDNINSIKISEESG